jgi:hypothetical protein
MIQNSAFLSEDDDRNRKPSRKRIQVVLLCIQFSNKKSEFREAREIETIHEGKNTNRNKKKRRKRREET